MNYPARWAILFIVLYVTGIVITAALFKRSGTDYSDADEGDFALFLSFCWPVTLLVIVIVAPFIWLYRKVSGNK